MENTLCGNHFVWQLLIIAEESQEDKTCTMHNEEQEHEFRMNLGSHLAIYTAGECNNEQRVEDKTGNNCFRMRPSLCCQLAHRICDVTVAGSQRSGNENRHYQYCRRDYPA